MESFAVQKARKPSVIPQISKIFCYLCELGDSCDWRGLAPCPGPWDLGRPPHAVWAAGSYILGNRHLLPGH